jgi:hypothetical protein
MRAGDQRAGQWARGKARREQYEFLRQRWRRLVLLGAVPLLMPCVAAILLPRFAAGLLLGAATTAVLGLLAFHVVQATGTAPIMAGDQAEQWTAQELRPLKRRGWRLINHFNLSDSGDIDHLLLGPPGAVAVETRWSAQPWAHNDITDLRVTEKVAQARNNARRLQMWQPFHSRRIPVQPVVMLWGRGLSDWPDGMHSFLVDGVQVVAGPRAKLWRRTLPQQAVLTHLQTDDTWAAIDQQTTQRDAHDRFRWPIPPSPLTLYTRGLLTLGAFTAGLLLAARVLEPLSWSGSGICAALLLPGGLALRHRTIRLVAMGWLAGIAAILLTAAIAIILAWTAGP